MKTRQLEKEGSTVSAVGLGCMGMSDFYAPKDEAESLAIDQAALRGPRVHYLLRRR